MPIKGLSEHGFRNTLSFYSAKNEKEMLSAIFSILAAGAANIFEQIAHLFDYAKGLPDKPIVPDEI